MITIENQTGRTVKVTVIDRWLYIANGSVQYYPEFVFDVAIKLESTPECGAYLLADHNKWRCFDCGAENDEVFSHCTNCGRG